MLSLSYKEPSQPPSDSKQSTKTSEIPRQTQVSLEAYKQTFPPHTLLRFFSISTRLIPLYHTHQSDTPTKPPHLDSRQPSCISQPSPFSSPQPSAAPGHASSPTPTSNAMASPATRSAHKHGTTESRPATAESSIPTPSCPATRNSASTVARAASASASRSI